MEGEDAVGVRGGDNRTGEGSGGDDVNADQASSVVTQGQSEAAAEGTHPVLCTGEAAYTARKRQKLHHKVCDLFFFLIERELLLMKEVNHCKWVMYLDLYKSKGQTRTNRQKL